MPPPYQEKGGNIFPSPPILWLHFSRVEFAFPEYQKKLRVTEHDAKSVCTTLDPPAFFGAKRDRKSKWEEIGCFSTGGNGGAHHPRERSD